MTATPLGMETQSGWILDVIRETKGHPLAAAATVGATALALTDVGDFIEGEGRTQVMVSGQVYDYETVDPETNTLTLATPLTVAAEADDPADLFDPDLDGTVVVGYEAKVMLDDSDPTDRPIDVKVSHALAQMLEESSRGAFGESVTLVRTGQYRWEIWQVDGKIAANLAADEAIAAADSAFDQALAALTEAQLALAIADGLVDIYYQTSAPWANGSTAHDDDTGDIWVDTDAATGTAYRWLDRMWTAIGDASIVAALLAAQSAQTTADGKIRLFVTSTMPTLAAYPDLSYGDLWRNPSEDNKEYYWDGDSWAPLLLGDDGIVAELVGKILTAGFIRTAANGNRVEIYDDGNAGIVEFYSDVGMAGAINATNNYLEIYDGTGNQRIHLGVNSVIVEGSNIFLEGAINLMGEIFAGTRTMHLDTLDMMNSKTISGGPTITGGPTLNGTVTLGSLTGAGGATMVLVGNAGVLSRGQNVSYGANDSAGAGFRTVRVPN